MNTLEALKMLDHYYGTYSRLEYTMESKQRIYEIAESVLAGKADGEIVSMDALHTTLYYSKDEPQPKLGQYFDYDHEIDDVRVLGFQLFGDQDDMLVLELFSPKIEKLKAAINDYAKPLEKFTVYRPHITIVKNFSGKLPSMARVFEDMDNLETTKLITTPVKG